MKNPFLGPGEDEAQQASRSSELGYRRGISCRLGILGNVRVFLRKIYNCTIPPPFLPPIPSFPSSYPLPLPPRSPPLLAGVRGYEPRKKIGIRDARW